MYLALIILPILGSIASGFFGRKIGIRGSQLITCTCIIITTILAIFAFIEVGVNNIPVTIHLIRWIDVESFNVYWGFNFDSLTISMLIPVLVVSSLVHVYSIGYMSLDPHNQRFFSYLSLFTFMMIILVTANNFLLMFVGWEGVGICSYLLVSFWFTRIAANQSSMSAFLTNRVGDCLLTIGMFAVLWSFGNIDYNTVFSLAAYYNENVVTIVGICLFIGAMAKSSQVGLHVWLPQAMEGPTPVSALIHAATMVTAGVYLLMRVSPVIEYSSTLLIICLWVGAITTVFSSVIGLFQQDIKKVIAYSTMSQLGMMVIAIGLSSYNIALFHLVNHAFYKGLLFLGAGAVIHAVADNQDFRKYGGLISYLPLTYSVMLIASLSLVAIPFMSGFYSKDFILESAYGQYHLSSIIVYFIATIGAMFTTLYSVKVLYLTFLSTPNGPLSNYKQTRAACEGDIFMSMPLILLAVFSIFFGYLTKDIFIGLASGFFSDNSLFIHPLHEITLDTEFALPIFFKLLPFFFTISLSLISILFTEFYPKLLVSFKLHSFGYYLFCFFNKRFFVELFYNKYVSGIILKLGGQTTEVMDKGLVELIGPYGLEISLTNLSLSINNLSTGVVTSYALYILIGLISNICVLYYSNFVKDFFNIQILMLLCTVLLIKKRVLVLCAGLKCCIINTWLEIFNLVYIYKLLSLKTLRALINSNTLGIAIRIICIFLGINIAIKSWLIFMLCLNLTCIIKCYICIVIDYKHINSKQLTCNNFKYKTFWKLIPSCIINLIVTNLFRYIDGGYNHPCVDCIQILVNLIKPYLSTEFLSILNNDIFIYLANLYSLNNVNLIHWQVRHERAFKVPTPRCNEPEFAKQDIGITQIQERVGEIQVKGPSGPKDIYAFNYSDIRYPLLPNLTPAYSTLNPTEREYYMNNYLAVQAKHKSHTLMALKMDNYINKLSQVPNPNDTAFRDIPYQLQTKIFNTEKATFKLVNPNGEGLTLLDEERNVSSIMAGLANARDNHLNFARPLETYMDEFKFQFSDRNRDTNARRALEEHRDSVLARAKSIRSTNSIKIA